MPGIDELESSGPGFAPTSELALSDSLDCTTWGKHKSKPYIITVRQNSLVEMEYSFGLLQVINNGADKVKILTCNRDVCSSGTHKYVGCPAYIEAGSTETVSVDQGVHYMVFYNGKTDRETECWPSSVGNFPTTLTLPLDPAACAIAPTSELYSSGSGFAPTSELGSSGSGFAATSELKSSGSGFAATSELESSDEFVSSSSGFAATSELESSGSGFEAAGNSEQHK